MINFNLLNRYKFNPIHTHTTMKGKNRTHIRNDIIMNVNSMNSYMKLDVLIWNYFLLNEIQWCFATYSIFNGISDRLLLVI